MVRCKICSGNAGICDCGRKVEIKVGDIVMLRKEILTSKYLGWYPVDMVLKEGYPNRFTVIEIFSDCFVIKEVNELHGHNCSSHKDFYEKIME
jgi:hypothetical protein